MRPLSKRVVVIIVKLNSTIGLGSYINNNPVTHLIYLKNIYTYTPLKCTYLTLYMELDRCCAGLHESLSNTWSSPFEGAKYIGIQFLENPQIHNVPKYKTEKQFDSKS